MHRVHANRGIGGSLITDQRTSVENAGAEQRGKPGTGGNQGGTSGKPGTDHGKSGTDHEYRFEGQNPAWRWTAGSPRSLNASVLLPG